MSKHMMVATVLVFLLLCSAVPSYAPSVHTNFKCTDNECNSCASALPDDYNGLDAENITFGDACYKGTDFLHPLEWWYFDAVFDNNYSIEFHIDLASIKGAGMVAVMLNVYDDGKLIFHSREYLLPSELNASKEKPLVFISGSKVIAGFIDNKGNWVFNLSTKMDGASINLKFASTTQGWKSKILNMWWWGVIQPKAYVSGVIQVLNKTMHVNGTGYQEHAWNGILPYVKGWYWGKFASNSMNIIWTNIIEYPWKQYLMVVLNKDNGGYVNIPPEKVQFSMSNYTYNDGWKIPASFHFGIEYRTIRADITADATNIIHQFSIGLFNYWRYHVHVRGEISYGSETEHIDNYQIMDFTRLW